MADYADVEGKINTRYTDLKRCTPKAVMKLVEEMHGKRTRYSGSTTRFGSTRHAMWEKESLATGYTPKCFEEAPCSYKQPVSYVEQAMECEPVPGVVLHSRTDSVALKDFAVIDNKTVTGRPDQYALNSKKQQILVYAYQLMLEGNRIDKAVYLCEIWDKEHTEIIGYQKVVVPITMKEAAWVWNRFIKPRCEVLKVAWKIYEDRQSVVVKNLT